MIAALGLAGLLVAAGCTAGSEDEPPLCPSGLPRVASVRIERQGAARWQEADEPPCAGFRLTAGQVRLFLRAARRTDRRALHFTLPESACVVRGTARFADGAQGRWQIDRFATGWLDRPGRARMTLYCRRCRVAPWSR